MTSFERFFKPKSLAVIGGGTWCENLILECQKIGYQGEIFPIHPTKKKIMGFDAYESVAALPQSPDAAFIGVNREATIEIVESLSKRAAGGAVCFASGFAEAAVEMDDALDLQTRLRKAAGKMPILGPNCYGLINALDRVAIWPDQHGCIPVDKGVAIITQSSNIAINMTMQRRGLPIAYVATAGNQAQIDISDLGINFLRDKRVTALGLHIEGIPNLQNFEALAREAAALEKPIIVLKVGASDQARAAAVSHTASLVGGDGAASALFKRLGMARAKSVEGFLEALKILHIVGPLKSNKIASLSCSGGEASLVADTALGMNVSFPPLNKSQEKNLRAALGPKVALANPLDYHTYIWGDKSAMTATFEAIMDPDLALGVIILDFPRADRCDDEAWHLVIEAVSQAQKHRKTHPMAILSSLPEALPEDIAHKIMAAGLIPLCGLTSGFEAITLASEISYELDDQEIWHRSPISDVQKHEEAEAKHLLQKFGADCPAGGTARGAENAAKLATSIGFPVVLKGEGFAHKSEAGAVALNLRTEEAVREAAAAMPTESFLVEEYIPDPILEILIGITHDPAHGFLLTLGAGGVFTEILQDTASLTLPCKDDEIWAALSSLRIAPRLFGFRGQPATERHAILAAIRSILDFAESHRATLEEVEVNPLLCTPTRAIVIDALITEGISHDT